MPVIKYGETIIRRSCTSLQTLLRKSWYFSRSSRSWVYEKPTTIRKREKQRLLNVTLNVTLAKTRAIPVYTNLWYFLTRCATVKPFGWGDHRFCYLNSSKKSRKISRTFASYSRRQGNERPIPQFIDDLLPQNRILSMWLMHAWNSKSGTRLSKLLSVSSRKNTVLHGKWKKQFYYCFGCGAKKAMRFHFNGLWQIRDLLKLFEELCRFGRT